MRYNDSQWVLCGHFGPKIGADPYVCMCRLGCHVCATPTEESSSYLGCAGQVVAWVVFMNGKVLTPLDSWDLFTWYLA